MKSITNQTNSLVKIGDIIIIKTPLPINPEEVKVLGYDVITQDIMDFQDWVGGHYAISPVSTDSSTSQNQLNWKVLWKDTEGLSESFVTTCAEQSEPYYIYFKFTKLESKTNQIINITKVNLKLQDSDTLDEFKKKYPYYYKSIFNEDSPNNEEVLTWQYNVLEKVSGDSILPHYVEKDKDFSTFWGWICHFFAIIVHFSRKFVNIFQDVIENSGLVEFFVKQKGYYFDSRVKINQDLKICLSEELYYSPIANQGLAWNGYPSAITDSFFSGYLPIKSSNIVIFKLGGFNSNELTSGKSVRVYYAFYSKEYTKISLDSVVLTASESLTGKRIQVPSNEEIAYLGISYYKLNGSSLPLYIRIYVEGEGNYFLESKEKEDIFKIQKDFRKRGTQSNVNLIKKVLETQKEDGFYANYLNKSEVGWFLNKNCPINSKLNSKIKIDALVPKTITRFWNGAFIEYLDQYLILNQNTSLNFTWEFNDTVNNIYVFASVYDKNNNKLEDVVFGNWQKDYDETSGEVKYTPYKKDSDSGIYSLNSVPSTTPKVKFTNSGTYSYFKVEGNNTYKLTAIVDCSNTVITKTLYPLGNTYSNVSNLYNKSGNFVAQTTTVYYLTYHSLTQGQTLLITTPTTNTSTEEVYFICFRQYNSASGKWEILGGVTDKDVKATRAQTYNFKNYEVTVPYSSNTNSIVLFVSTFSGNSTIVNVATKNSEDLYPIAFFKDENLNEIVGGVTNKKLNSSSSSVILNSYQLYVPANATIVGVCSSYNAAISLIKGWVEINQKPTYSNFWSRGICLTPKLNSTKTKYEATMPINIVKDIYNGEKFGIDYDYGLDLINQNLYFWSKYDKNGAECKYLKIKNVFLSKNEAAISDYGNCGIITHNIKDTREKILYYNSSIFRIELIIEGEIVGSISKSTLSKGLNILNFDDYGSVWYYGDPSKITEDNFTVTLKDDTSTTALIIGDLSKFETDLNLRKLPMSLGFLNNSQYYLCCFKNNGTYIDEEAKEIINQKILPYNGMRLFVNNSDYKDDISVPLQIDDITIENKFEDSKINKTVTITVKGGVAPYIYTLDGAIAMSNYNYYKTDNVKTGNHTLVIKDSIGNQVSTSFSCSDYNKINYKLKAGIDIDSKVEIYIYIYGGTEKYYTVTHPTFTKIVSPKTWTKLTDSLSLSYTSSDYNFINIKDEGIDKSISGYGAKIDLYYSIFQNCALDIYDDGVGMSYEDYQTALKNSEDGTIDWEEIEEQNNN